MLFKGLIAGVAALALSATPAAAAATQAAAASRAAGELAPEAETVEGNELRDGGIIIPLIGVAIVLLIIYFLTKKKNENPRSP